ncbi:MAG: hypothetical protein KDB33_09190 [Acidimicrobiales bacterium]|nr:hypothetical protein [Acidimicrobiales bacterium]MCB1260547.1 hypothetical protein [Acidimicrobiales bacterium]
MSTEPKGAGSAHTIVRSPADVLRLVVAAVAFALLLLVELFFGSALVEFTAQLLQGASALPSWLLTGVVIVTRIGVTVVFWVGLVVSLWRRRFRLLLTMVVAVLASTVIYTLVDDALETRRESLVTLNDTVLVVFDEGDYPTAAALAAAIALLTAAAPWLSRRGRRLGWTLVVLLAVSRFLTAPVSFDSPVAFASGWFAGAAVLVAMGAPARRASRDSVMDGLTGVGVDLAELEPAAVDARGSTPYFGTTTDGHRLFVKVLGEDERSADLLFRMYRRVLPRDLGDERPFSSLRRAVEHEALVALAARDAGVRTPRLVAFAACEPASFVLAYEAIEGASWDRFTADELTPDKVTALWELVQILRRHRIAHRDLRLANLFLGADGEVWLIDFGFSELAASDTLLATDLAELLTSMASVVGPEASIAAGYAAVGDDIVEALPRLRSFALSGATRSAVKADPELLPGVERAVRAATGA